MPAVSNRRRLVPALMAGVAAVLLLAGCTGQRDPDSWGDSTKRAFVEGCDGTAAEDEPVESIRTDLEEAALPTEVCQCIVDHLEDNMEFSEFKDANSKRRDETDERTPLTGGGFDDAYAACVPDREGGTGATDTPGDDTTTPVDDTTTSTEAS